MQPQFGMTIVLCANMSGLGVPLPTSSIFNTPKYPTNATREDVLGFFVSDPLLQLLRPTNLPIKLPVRRAHSVLRLYMFGWSENQNHTNAEDCIMGSADWQF